MLLPASDLWLIATHLPTRYGMIMKVKLMEREAKEEKLLELLNTKVGILRSHVRIMMDMLDPDKSDSEKLPEDHLETTCRGSQLMDKHIAQRQWQSKTSSQLL
ncbi:MAG: hypothetical protein U9Q88_13080 [Bacillota bacterium]|nr:hypothetical protein [Bacillota bacterium]